MGNKKKFLGGLKLLSFLLFTLLFVNLSTICRAEDERYIQLSATQVELLGSDLGLSNYYSGDYVYTWQNTFNQWMRQQEALTGYDWADYNILFNVPSGATYICWVVVARQSGQSSIQPDIYLETLNPNSTSLNLRGFNNWNRNSNNDINGLTGKPMNRYYILSSSPNIVQLNTINATSYTIITNPVNSITITTNSVGEYDCFIERFILWEPHQFKGGIQRIAGRNTSIPTGYDYFWLTHTLRSGSGDPTPTPTPIPTGGGGGSTDLTETNNLIGEVKDSIDDLNDNLTSFPRSGDFPSFSSGDILDTLDMAETVDPYENFWATFINGLNTALTCPNNTTYNIEIFGETYTIDSADWAIDYPQPLKYILIIACTIGIVFAELKMWRKIIIAINTGNLMNLAISYSNDDITDLF